MELELKKTYSFKTRSPAFLGASVERARLTAVVDATTARLFAPIDQLHAQIYPTLPRGSILDPDAHRYFVFEGQNKSRVVMAESWIVESTIQEITSMRIDVTVPNASNSDVEAIRRALSAAGILDFHIQTTVL
jgi:hypothetical protein